MRRRRKRKKKKNEKEEEKEQKEKEEDSWTCPCLHFTMQNFTIAKQLHGKTSCWGGCEITSCIREIILVDRIKELWTNKMAVSVKSLAF